ncbi:MAG: mechanosensitive ion channel [Candidatus Omnitrophica bacterium]|nr:mechanosensitive ion channel [Candidatus Omnitrophota bacterium]
MKGVSKKIGFEVLKTSFISIVLLLALGAFFVFYKVRLQQMVSAQFQEEAKKYLATAFVIAIVFVIQRVVGACLAWYKENIASKTPSKLDDELIPLLRRTFKIVIWAVAVLLILPFYGININALIATLGVGSLAIALAAQDTIANIIAGFLIMADRPFRLGDRIKLPSGEVVKVLDIGVRRSRFLSEDKAIVIVPNLELSKSKIVNYTYGEEGC